MDEARLLEKPKTHQDRLQEPVPAPTSPQGFDASRDSNFQYQGAGNGPPAAHYPIAATNGSWVTHGTSVAGMSFSGRCIIGSVASGVFVLIVAIILYAESGDYLSFENGYPHYERSPLKIVAPIVLVFGLALLLVGLIGIFYAMKEFNNRTAGPYLISPTVRERPAPIISGNPSTPFAPHNQTIYGTTGPLPPVFIGPHNGTYYPQQMYATPYQAQPTAFPQQAQASDTAHVAKSPLS